MIRLSKDDSFIIYQEPQKKQSFIGLGIWKKLDQNHSFKENTFVFSLFDSLTYLLEGKICKLKSKVEIKSAKKINTISTEKRNYLDSVDSIIKKCKEGEIKKCILSRIIVSKNDESNLFTLYQKLTEKYKHGFTYILNHPMFGMWIGVSPETLLKGNSDKGFFSQALAGTKTSFDKKNWSIKEIEEHQYVALHLRTKIKSHGMIIKSSDVHEKIAGNVQHLNQEFFFKLKSDLFQFINEFHPTPAIAGIPLNKSLKIINQYEDHSRSLYCGYLGIINNNSCNLYVNLRCARINLKEIQIFVGGGITEKSIPNNEYLETEIKSQTLLSVIKKI